MEMGIGEGTTHRFGPADVVLAAALTDQGHPTRSVEVPRVRATVAIADGAEGTRLPAARLTLVSRDLGGSVHPLLPGQVIPAWCRMVPPTLAVLPGYIVEWLIDGELINVVEETVRLDHAIRLAPGPSPFHLVGQTRAFDIRMRRVSSPRPVILDPGDPGLVIPDERNTWCQCFRMLHGVVTFRDK